MNILIINHYAGAPHLGRELRPYFFAKNWQKVGHHVTIAAADHTHLRSNAPVEGHGPELRRIGEDNGIHCNQSHAPFPVECPAILDLQKKAIECTAEAGGKICIIHPDNKKNADENARMYEDLLSFAKSCGVKIATENMWNWDRVLDQAAPAACSDPDSFNAHLDAVNDPYFVACLDLGHAEMRGLNTTAVDMIHALGSRLQALHIHDNDRWHDSHQLPFTMDMQFEPIVRALKDIGYSGYFTLEVDRYPSSFTADTAFTCVQNMAATARKLADMFEAL